MEGCSEEAGLLRHLERVASEEEEVPLVVYLKENAALLTANGLHLSQNRETQKSPPTPPPVEAHGPAPDVNQNLAPDVNQNLVSPSATLSTPASNSSRSLPATDANQNPAAAAAPQSRQHNSSEAQPPAPGTVPDSTPGTQGTGGHPREQVRPGTLLTDKASAPSAASMGTFPEEAAPSSGSPGSDFTSSSLPVDVQPGAPAVPSGQEPPGRAAATTTPTTPTKLYSEVHLTLAKPGSVVNRTARPFGAQAPGGTGPMEWSPMVERRHLGGKAPTTQPPGMADRSPRPQRHATSHSPAAERRPLAQRSPASERRPVGNFAPPPTYAETLSAAPQASRVRSPPSYSALYPSSDSTPPRGKGQALPAAGKTGILEESMARRGSRKSMFTFVEKPKVAPNPDLLDLVQTADEKRRQRDQGEAGGEEEPFALGAEASNFQQEPAPRDRDRDRDGPPEAENAVPEWASCLKSPRIQAKPKPRPNQNLSEASGKGAELYARRQSRMEKYVIESSGHAAAELARCPSPTMSLPSSWKYSPGSLRVASRSPARTPPASLYHGYLPENGVLRPEPTKQPPYQLRPSLFVLSPIKEPTKASPRAASPAKPSSLDLAPSLPKATVPRSPALPRPSRASPGLYPAPGQDGLQPAAASPTYSSDISPVSPSRAWSPRAKQAPRPSFNTRNVGIEAQVWKPSFCFK